MSTAIATTANGPHQKLRSQSREGGKSMNQQLSKFLSQKAQPTKVNESIFAKQECDLQERQILNKMFNGWLEYHHDQKTKWQNLVKYRYLVSRIKLNKLFWAWKIQIREQKVLKLKESLIVHQIYKLNLQNCFKAWKNEYLNLRQGLKIFSKVADKRVKRVVMAYMNYRNKDQWAKEYQLYQSKRFYRERAKKKLIKILKKHAKYSKEYKGQILRVQKHLQIQLKKKYFRHIRDFSQLNSKKMASYNKVQSFLNQKYRQRVMVALRTNYGLTQDKDVMIRKAMSFQVFKSKYYLLKRAFRGLKEYPKLKQRGHDIFDLKVKTHIIYRAFRAFQIGIRVSQGNEALRIKEFQGQMMRLKYFSMWKKFLASHFKDRSYQELALTHYDKKLCHRLIQQLKSAIYRQQQLNNTVQQVQSKVESRILSTVLQRLSDLKQVKSQRQVQFTQTLTKVFKQSKKRYFVKFRNQTCLGYRLMIAQNFKRTYTMRKVIRIFKNYQSIKIQQQINQQLSRKFYYMRLLQKSINSFKLALIQRDKLEMQNKSAQSHRTKQLLAKAMQPFKHLDYEQRMLIALANKFWRRLQLKIAKKIWNIFDQYKFKKQDQRQKMAMAMIHERNRLEKTYFKILKVYTKNSVKSKQTIQHKERRISERHERTYKQAIITHLKSHRREAQENQNQLLKARRILGKLKARSIIQELREYTFNQQEKREKYSLAYLFHQRLSQMKLILLLKHNVKLQKIKKQKISRALKSWSKRVKQITFLGLKAFLYYQKEKAQAIEQAFKERQRVQIMAILYKVQRVGQYWKAQNNDGYFERQLAQKFLRWKYVVFGEGTSIGKRPQFVEERKLPLLLKQSVNQRSLLTQSMKPQSFMEIPKVEISCNPPLNPNLVNRGQSSDVLDWLKTFDTKPKTQLLTTQPVIVTQQVQRSQNFVEVESQHRSKLRDIDAYLSTLKSTVTKTSIKPQNPFLQNQGTLMKTQTQNNAFDHTQPLQTQTLDFQRFQTQELTPPFNQSEWQTPIKQTSFHIQKAKDNYSIQSNQQSNITQKLSQNFQNKLPQQILSTKKNTNKKERIMDIEGQIRRFLGDKELLRQLEQSEGHSTVVQLMREEIKGKSGHIQQLLEELKLLKRAA